jgi:hypothetical protein
MNISLLDINYLQLKTKDKTYLQYVVSDHIGLFPLHC